VCHIMYVSDVCMYVTVCACTFIDMDVYMRVDEK